VLAAAPDRRPLQAIQLGAPARQQGGQLGWRTAVAARQRMPLADALVQRGQLLGVQVGAAQIGVQAARGVAQLRFGGLQGSSRALNSGSIAAEACRASWACARAGSAPPSSSSLSSARLAASAASIRPARGQARVLLAQLVPFALARRQLVELADLPLQALAFLGQAVLRAACRVQHRLRLLPGVPCRQQRRAVDAGVGVQQGAHGGRAGQALPGVLAVDVQQLLASSRSCAAVAASR
jgi:hypothetical protein